MENSTNEAYLKLDHLVKVYPNGEKAVYDFTLDIAKNDFVVIVGPSGCGKSTTLRMVAGLEDISSGSLFMDGELLNYKECKDRKMAIVFQSYALYPQMSVYDNIAFPLTINKYDMPVINTELEACAEARRALEEKEFSKIVYAISDCIGGKGNQRKKTETGALAFATTFETGKLLISLYETYGQEKEKWFDGIAEYENKAKETLNGATLNERFCEVDEEGKEKHALRKLTPYEIRQKVYDAAKILDLTNYLEKLPKELSGGQMQRVALGRAIVKNVPVFMMDEPLSNLDAKLRLTMRTEIVKLHNEINATTIYVTHDQTEAMTMATKIVVMSHGFVQQIGTPKEIYNNPDNIFVAKFIGSPSINTFDMEYDEAGNELVYNDLKIKFDPSFAEKHRAFYQERIAMFERLFENFDLAAREKILNILSVTGEYSDRKTPKQKPLAGLIGRVKKLFEKKKQVEENPYAFERGVAEEKLALLKKSAEGKHVLTVAIRPENVHIQKYDPAKKQSGIVVQPYACELLGGEYYIYFDYCGKKFVSTINAKEDISTADKIVMDFSFDDVAIFDSVTGEAIR